MRGAHSVETGHFHQFGLAILSIVEGGGTQYAVVVVQAATVQHDGLSVEQQPLLSRVVDGAYAVGHGQLVALGLYGRLIEVAGSDKLVATKNKNEIYNKIKGYNEELDKWKDKLEMERDRYIKQFSNLETLINSMNSQSSYLSSLSY